MTAPPPGSRPTPGARRPAPELARRYRAEGWWGDEALGSVVRRWAAERPDGLAYVTPHERLTWAGYSAAADRLATTLVGLGLAPGERVGVQLPDRPLVHVTFLATERAGLIAAGIGLRAGDAEVAHLLSRAGARVLVVADDPSVDDAWVATRATALAALGAPLDHVLALSADGSSRAWSTAPSSELEQGSAVPPGGPVPVRRSHHPPSELEQGSAAPPGGPVPVRIEPAADDAVRGRALGPDDVFLLSTTSGTTGRPKCVVQFQNRWVAFHRLAVEAGRLTDDDVFASLIPAPFGFGIWTAHMTPTLLGAPCALLPKFDAGAALRLLADEGVTVLACVSTQFLLMLDSPVLDEVQDRLRLRVMFTGGERVPDIRARRWEERTGGTVLQFFGSNESGAFSYTTLDDPLDRRVATAGRLIPEMHVRLFDEHGADVTATGGPAQPGGSGPLLSLGYWDDEAANDELYTDDGWLLMGDLVEVDDEGWVTVAGRTSDFVIRGGKNISAAQVEELVGNDPRVAVAAVVPVPDEVFGERVCAVVEPAVGHDGPIDLPSLVAGLRAAGAGAELCPEHLIVLPALPRSSGAKVAKGDLRRLAAELCAGRPPGTTIDRR